MDARSDASATADAALAGIIETVGAPAFPTQALAQLNTLLRAGSWSVYRLRTRRPPVMYLSGSYQRLDTTLNCWHAYRAGLYEKDGTFDAVGAESRRLGTMLCHVTANDIPQRAHRERIYRRYGVLDRLSIVSAQPDDTLLAINLYHHERQGHFSDREFYALERIGRGLLAAVNRHIALTNHETVDRARARRPSIEEMRDALHKLQPALTQREVDVCARLLVGMTYDGIAADLGVSVATVKTYRNRAFARLGIHFRSELFALTLSSRAAGAG